ncbi:3'-5' exonuclease [Singulisphaera sp. Ch08]|uniref:3'-5' exonuclease n=1 Tax=Singulisphaera sp. Ch08 TaxID=3120278 RepID=A0AAU7CGY4_9BACT
MSVRSSGVLHRALNDTPIAVLDFETTGLSPGVDRVVEVSVVRVDPGARPRLVFDTLINPDRRMAATEVHGITDQAVADAPRFKEVAADLCRALSDCVLAAHNVYFDLRFLRFELEALGRFQEIPHLCTMHSRPLLGLKACGLDDACKADQIAFTPTHNSRSDSMAAALLWMRYRDLFTERNILTYRDLTLLGKRYKFFSSFACSMLTPSKTMQKRLTHLKPREQLAPASEWPLDAIG